MADPHTKSIYSESMTWTQVMEALGNPRSPKSTPHVYQPTQPTSPPPVHDMRPSWERRK